MTSHSNFKLLNQPFSISKALKKIFVIQVLDTLEQHYFKKKIPTLDRNLTRAGSLIKWYERFRRRLIFCYSSLRPQVVDILNEILRLNQQWYVWTSYYWFLWAVHELYTKSRLLKFMVFLISISLFGHYPIFTNRIKIN